MPSRPPSRRLPPLALAGPLLALVAAATALAADAPAPAESFTPTAEFRNFTRHNARGLPQSTVRQMVQDGDGALWLGTMDGLAMFDGTQIKEVVPAAPLPPFGSINSIVPRRAGGLYVAGTPGIYRFDGTTWALLPATGLAVSVAEEPGGRLWYADQAGVLWRTNGPTDGRPSWLRIPLPQSGPVTKVMATDSGALWVASRAAITRLADERVELCLPLPVAAGVVTAMTVARDGTCWVGTHGGHLLRILPGATAWNDVAVPGLPVETISSLAEDRFGRIWCGTLGGHLVFGAPGRPWSVWGSDNGLNGPSGIMGLLADREGTLWLGLNANGVQQLLSESWRHRQSWDEAGRSSSSGGVFGIAPTSDGGILAAVFGHGIWIWDGHAARQAGGADGLGENTRCVAEPEPGVIWVGHRFGLSESRQGGPFRRILTTGGGFVTGLYRSPTGAWYAATSTEGIYERSGGDWKPASVLNAGLVDLQVRGMTWRGNGELWVACNSGLSVFAGGQVRRHTPATNPGLPVPVNCTLEVGPDEMWVAGLGGIAVTDERPGPWRTLTAASGLPGRTIYSLARAPDGSVWAGGSHGVGRFSGGHWSVHDTRNGLLDEECNVNGLHIAADGTVYVGTMGGLARFRPGPAAALPPAPLRLHWLVPAYAADGNAVFPLPAGQRTLEVSWIASWLAPTAVEYRTRVLPLNPAWSEPSERHDMLVQNLGPGDWTLEVQARLSGAGDDGWTSPLQARVSIPPLFRETVWARALALLGFGLLSLGLARLWTWRLERKRRALQSAVAEAQANVKTLRGLIPICAHCKNIRDDRGAWNQLEAYVHAHSEAEFSHGICPECARKLYPQYANKADRPPL